MLHRWQPTSPLAYARMTPAQKAMMLAEQQAEFHTAELDRHLELEADFEAAMGERLAHPHTELQAAWAVDALTTLGRFDEARKIAHLAPPEYADIIEAHDAACQRDDTERCECEHPTTPNIEGGNGGMAVRFGDDKNPKYLIERPYIFNPYAKRLDTVYGCPCGHRNALPEPPDKITADHYSAVNEIHRNAAP